MTISIQIEDRSIVVTPEPGAHAALTRDQLEQAIQALNVTQNYLQQTLTDVHAPSPHAGPRWKFTEESMELLG